MRARERFGRPLDEVAACLASLESHLQPAAWALAGGVAIHLHLTAAGLHSGRHSFVDVDLIAADAAVVRPSASDEFLISHYHLPHPGYRRFLVQLVDPVTRLRVDIFPEDGTLAEVERVVVAGSTLRVVPVFSLLERKLDLLNRAGPASPVDPKHYRDAVALAGLLGKPAPRPPDLGLANDGYGADPAASCARCDASRSPGYPLASKERILDILGYV